MQNYSDITTSISEFPMDFAFENSFFCKPNDWILLDFLGRCASIIEHATKHELHIS